jgi:hypothetical protein
MLLPAVPAVGPPHLLDTRQRKPDTTRGRSLGRLNRPIELFGVPGPEDDPVANRRQRLSKQGAGGGQNECNQVAVSAVTRAFRAFAVLTLLIDIMMMMSCLWSGG